MIPFLKKPIIIIPLIVLIGGGALAYVYLGRDNAPAYDFIIAERRDLIQEVSVTGKVKPAQSVELAFEKAGKVSRVYADVGTKVSIGQTLVVLENAETAAQLAQAEAKMEGAKTQLVQREAILAREQAKLDELNRGIRIEEIQVAKVKVENAKNAIIDADNNLENVKQKAIVDLQNIYNDIPDILYNAYLKADDAVRKQTDEMFENDDTSSVSFTFLITDSQAEIDAKWQRQIAGQKLKQWKTEIDNLSSDAKELEQALDTALEHLSTIRTFLNRLMEAVNAGVGISQSTIATYKSNINTGRTNVNTVIENINIQKQTITAQKVLNQKDITAAETKVNDAKNALAVAESELALKEAGTTPEQIAAQEAQIRQAEADILSQKANIKDAEANVDYYRAQLAKTVIRAPISGTVTKQDAKTGQIVSANTPIVSLISASRFEIEANLPEADIAKVKVGDTAKVTLDAYGRDVVFEANVAAIDPAETIVDGVATYKITFQFTKDDERIKSGMTANIDVLTGKREGVIAIPQRAVIRKNGGQFARILVGEEIKEVPIETGLRGSDGNVEITSGISVGDKVITFSEESR